VLLDVLTLPFRLSNTSCRDHHAVADELAIRLLHAWLGKAMNADTDATGGYNQLRTSNRGASNRRKQNDQEHGLPHCDNAPTFFFAVTIIYPLQEFIGSTYASFSPQRLVWQAREPASPEADLCSQPVYDQLTSVKVSRGEDPVASYQRNFLGCGRRASEQCLGP
jgi:hypothetical protein